MSKTRNLLLAASAMVAVAGPAFAQKTIVFGDVSEPPNATNGVQNDNYFLAKQVTFATTGPTANAGWVEFKLAPSASATFPVGNTVITLNVAGGTFDGAGSPTWVVIPTTGATCLASNSVTANISGTPSSTSITFQMSGMSNCDGTSAADQIGFRIPVRVAGPTAPFTVDLGFTTDALIPIDGPTFTGPKNAVQIADAVDLDITSNTGTAATALVSTAYGNLNISEPTLGNIDLDFTTDVSGFSVYKNLAYTGITSADIAGSTFVITTTAGAYAGLTDLDIDDSPPATFAGNVATFGLSASDTNDLFDGGLITVEDASGLTAIAAQDFTFTGTVSFSSGSGLTGPQTLTAPGTTTPIALAEIVRDGTQVYIPWVASGPTASVSTSNNVLRVGNQGATAVVVRAVIQTATATGGSPTVISSGSLPSVAFTVGTAPARGELLITSADLSAAAAAALGAGAAQSDWGRGDVLLIVEAPPSDISVRKVVQRPEGSFEGFTTASSPASTSPGTR
jgi:hypothetical protein